MRVFYGAGDSREDRQWNEQRTEIERIAQTLAIARLLDQRREWFEQQLSQQQRLTRVQRDLLDNLLHQFRNLTALRTFGKPSQAPQGMLTVQ